MVSEMWVLDAIKILGFGQRIRPNLSADLGSDSDSAESKKPGFGRILEHKM